jgi:hypothetical protein
LAIPVLAGTLTVGASARADLGSVDLRRGSERSQFQRRFVDIALRSGGALAECEGDCGSLRPFGPAVGLCASFRMSPLFAFGLLWEQAWFQQESETAHVLYAGLVARIYVPSESRLDPWFEFGVLPFETGTASAPAEFGLGAGVGLDVFASPFVKLGPHARFDFMFPARQTGGATADTDGGRIQPVSAMLQFGVAATFTFGPVLNGM